MDVNQQRDNLKHLAVIILVLHQAPLLDGNPCGDPDDKGETENERCTLVVLPITASTTRWPQVNEYPTDPRDLLCSGILSKSCTAVNSKRLPSDHRYYARIYSSRSHSLPKPNN